MMGKNTNDIFKNASSYLNDGLIKTDEIKRGQIITEGIKHLQNYLNPLGVTRLSNIEAALFSLANLEADIWADDEQKSALKNLAIIKFSQDGKSRDEVRDTIIGLSGGGKKKKNNPLNFKPKQEEVSENE
jgi:5'-3' exonuclease